MIRDRVSISGETKEREEIRVSFSEASDETEGLLLALRDVAHA